MLGFLKSENTILVVILTVLVTRWVMKWKNEDHAYLIAIFVFTIGYAGLSYVNNIWFLFVLMVIATVGELMRVPIQQDYLASIPTDEKRSSYMAMYGLVFNGSMMISSIFVSLGAVLNNEAMSVLILLTGLIGLIITKSILPDLKKRRQAGT